MAIILQVSNVSSDLMTAIQDAAWDLNTSTTIANYDTADVVTGKKYRWQIAFNETTGKAAVVDINAQGKVIWLDAKNVADAAYQASKTVLTL